MKVRIRGRARARLPPVRPSLTKSWECLGSWPVFIGGESKYALWSGESELASSARPGPGDHRRSAPTGCASNAPAPRRGVLGRLEGPRLKIACVLLEGTDSRIPDRSIGHAEGKGATGEAGNVGIAGHRNTHPKAGVDPLTN